MTTHISNTTTSNSRNSDNETNSIFSSSLVIVTSILGHCHFTDLFNAQLVNRSWCRYANSRGVWEVMIIKKLYNIDFNQYTPLYSPIIINGRYQLQPIQETQYRYDDLFNATPQQLNEIKYESSQYFNLDAISYYNKNLTNQTYLKSLFQKLFPHDYLLHQSLQFVQSLIPIIFNSNGNEQEKQSIAKEENELNNNNGQTQENIEYFVKNYNHKNIDSSYLDSKFGYISRKVTCPIGAQEYDILGHIKKSIKFDECKLTNDVDADRYNTPPNTNGYIFISQEDQSFSTASWDGSIYGNDDGTVNIEKQTILVPSPSSSFLNNNQSIDSNNNNNLQYYKTIEIFAVKSRHSYPSLGFENAEYYGQTSTYLFINLIDHSKEGERIHLRNRKSFTLNNSPNSDDKISKEEDEGQPMYHGYLDVNIPLKNLNQIMEFINLPQSTRDDMESMVNFLLPRSVHKRKLVVDSISRYDFNPIMISNAKQLKYKIRLLEEIHTRNEFKNDLELKNNLINLVQQMYDMKEWKNKYEHSPHQQTLDWDFQVTFTIPYNGDGKLEISISISLCDPKPAVEDLEREIHIYYCIDINSVYNGTELVIYKEVMEESGYIGRTGNNLQENLNQALHDKYPHFPVDMVTLLKLFKVDNHIKLVYSGKDKSLICPAVYHDPQLKHHMYYIMNDPYLCYNLSRWADDDNYDHTKYTPLFTPPDDISWWDDIYYDNEYEYSDDSENDDDSDSNDDDSDSEVKEEEGNEDESNNEIEILKKEKSDLKRVNEDQGDENTTKYQKHDI